jgi:very-short-patch-repair endonuclease
MGQRKLQSSRRVWVLAREQHGVVARRQLLALGFNADAIHHRIEQGRLHPVQRGVYAVGRPELTRHGTWMAAVLSCGPGAGLSHTSAGGLWEVHAAPLAKIEVSVHAGSFHRRPGIVVHRRTGLTATDLTQHRGIPVTAPVCTFVDLATCLERDQLEAAINEADRRDVIDPETLRSALDPLAGRPGVAVLRNMLDRRTFAFTDSELERRFLPLARRAGLPPPLTQQWVNGFRVDFFWPDLGLVVETDGLRYHRTAAQQAKDRRRDQAHTAAGLTPLRFTHAQVRFEARQVGETLATTSARLSDRNRSRP